MKGTVKHIILFIALIAAFAAVEVLGPIFQCIERDVNANFERLVLYAFFNAGIVMSILSLLHKYVFAGMLTVTTIYGIFAYMNLLHYRTLDSFFPFYMLTETQQLDGLQDNIIGAMFWYDLSFLIVLAALWYLFVRLRKCSEGYRFSRHMTMLGIYMVLMFALINISNTRQGWRLGNWHSTIVNCCKFSPVECYTRIGMMAVTIYQIDNIQSSAKGLSEEERNMAELLVRRNLEIFQALPKSVEPKQNLIILLLESFNTACISPQVMPTLDSIRQLPSSLYFPKVKQLTQGGMSIGGQLVVASGLHGLLNAPFCSACPYNIYPSVARAQKEAHDSTYSYTIVSSDRNFWRQSEVSNALGFDALFDRYDVIQGNTNKHGWADDSSLLDLTVSNIPLDGTPFVSMVVPSDMHSPYTRDESIEFEASFPEVEDPLLLEYLRRARHLDELMGGFIKALKEKGVYENTLIVITSDHQVPEAYCSEAMNEWKSAYIPVLFINAGEQWKDLGPETSESVFCHSQLYPTMLHLMGLCPDNYAGFFSPMTDIHHSSEYDFENLDYNSTSDEKLKKIYELEERMVQCGYFGKKGLL